MGQALLSQFDTVQFDKTTPYIDMTKQKAVSETSTNEHNVTPIVSSMIVNQEVRAYTAMDWWIFFKPSLNR